MTDSSNENILLAVEKALNNGARFYCYRLPGGEDLDFGVQTCDLAINMGFCINPFVEGDIKPCFISRHKGALEYLSEVSQECVNSHVNSLPLQSSIEKDDYLSQAEKCVVDLKSGKLGKIVLSRTIASEKSGVSWAKVFKSLLDAYPNAFVFMYHTEETGYWLGATPEKLLCNHGGEVSTMALAGTRLAGTQSDWGEKEIVEQKIVADYIGECFKKAGIEYEMTATYTRNAGNIEHLCNDFKGQAKSKENIEALKLALHPTPAIAGVPCKEAVDYICEVEAHNRRCYGGYIGPVNENGDFDLFVNLRSIEFAGEKYCMYVGGGLTSSSNPEKEWQETAEKAKTLQRFL